ncbi:hypothetical protein H4Q26_017939 [Puccinia striiformis f. sp. tritici PST-130]|nr:hypothetical protein H4Q26_017939 [Puccinia striiformis f. sp. tritici PST-130]
MANKNVDEEPVEEPAIPCKKCDKMFFTDGMRKTHVRKEHQERVKVALHDGTEVWVDREPGNGFLCPTPRCSVARHPPTMVPFVNQISYHDVLTKVQCAFNPEGSGEPLNFPGCLIAQNEADVSSILKKPSPKLEAANSHREEQLLKQTTKTLASRSQGQNNLSNGGANEDEIHA